MLSQAINAPDAGAVDAAVTLLVQVGALAAGEVLTPLGKHLAQLPVDVRIGLV